VGISKAYRAERHNLFLSRRISEQIC